MTRQMLTDAVLSIAEMPRVWAVLPPDVLQNVLTLKARPLQREYERELRRLERAIRQAVTAYLRGKARQVAESMESMGVWRWGDTWEDELYDILMPHLADAARLGGKAGLVGATAAGVNIGGVAWGRASIAAAQWAAQHVGDLVRQITETTRAQIQAATATFYVTPGMTRGTLEDLILGTGIEPLAVPGRIISAAERAEMIATTEVTRAYTGANIAAMQATGVAQVQPQADKVPPLHPRCRCDAVPMVRDDGTISWKYQTLNDDLVCDICGPLNEQDIGQ